MAQELELIVDMLREMQRANSANSASFDKLLASISKKIDVMDNNSMSTDLIKAYLSELAKSLDDKYNKTLDKFSAVEQALTTVYNRQDNSVKTKDMKELFDIFSKNMNNFYTETKQQKALLSTMEMRLAEMSSNKSDKEDILRTITLLRNDFENLNYGYKSTIDKVNSDLKSILTTLLKSDQSAVTAELKDQVDILYRSINDMINYLSSIDKREANLEQLIANVATSESLKFTQGAIDSIITKTQEINERISILPNRAEFNELQETTNTINSKLNDVVNKKSFTKITQKTDALIAQTDEIKENLANITKDIESLPDTTLFENSIKTMFAQLTTLEQDISSTNAKEITIDIQNKLLNLSEELGLIKNIVTDINDIMAAKILTAINDINFTEESSDIKEHVSRMLETLPQKEDINRILENDELNKQAFEYLIKKTDILADRLDSLPTHDDMDNLNNTQLSLVENLQGVANKEDIEHLSTRTDEIENMIDKLNFDKEFEHIYDKTSSIAQWLIDSKIKENSDELTYLVKGKAAQKDVVEILNKLENVVDAVDELSNNTDVKKVNRTVADVYQLIEDLKNDFINTTDMHNDSVIVQLSELQKVITDLTTGEDFDRFKDDLTAFIEKIINDNAEFITNFDEIRTYQHNIIEQLENINISSIENKLLTISDYLININDNKSFESIKLELGEIKEILENKKSNFNQIEANNSQITTNIEDYLKEIKVILDTSDKNIDSNTLESINKLEESLQNYQSSNENVLIQIIDKIDNFQTSMAANENSYSQEDIKNSIAEISELKDRIIALGQTFNQLNYNKESTENNVSSFVCDKLSEIGNNLDDLSQNIESNLQSGFAYNAELIEEKTAVLLDFIKELRHNNTENIELFERLTVTDNKLIDFKQQLEFINTDVINSLNSKTEQLLEELEPIKQMIAQLGKDNFAGVELKSNLESVYENTKEELIESTKYSQSTFEKLEAAYEQISKDLSATETNIKDFILSDIDSVILKIDELKDSVEENLNKITPPDAELMTEFKEFVEEINSFKQEQRIMLKETADDIKESLSMQMNLQHDELKSILTVAMNNEEIITAIEDLKKCFNTKISEIKSIKTSELDEFDQFDSNEFERPFELDDNSDAINEIRQDFNRFSELIQDLSGENQEIKEVLNVIKTKMERISVIQGETAMPANSESGTNETPVLIGDGNFDFIKALNFLKQDIQTLNTNVESVIPQKTSPENISGTTETQNLEKLAQLINPQQWLDEIKNYIAGDEIHNMLEEISGKIDILTLSNNSEWVSQIKQALQELNIDNAIKETDPQIQSMLELINEKIDIIASSNDYDVVEGVRDALENFDSEQSKETEKLLNIINEKIDIIANSSENDVIEEVRNALENFDSEQSKETEKLLNIINEKIDILATSNENDVIEEVRNVLENFDSEQSKETEKLLSIINEKIDILASGDDPEILDNNLTNIKESLNIIENKVDVIAASDDSEGFEDIIKLLGAIEKKIEQNQTDINQDSFSEIKEILESIEFKIDRASSAETLNNIEDIKYTLLNVDEKIDAVKNNESDKEITSKLELLDSKIDVIAETSSIDDLEEIKQTLQDVDQKVETINKLSESDAKITSILELLNHKIDIIADSEHSINQRDFQDIKDLIMAQTDYIDSLEKSNKTDAVKKCLRELTIEVNNLNSNDGTKQIQKTIKDMKESIMAAVVSVFEQVSFIEESEDIKDFVEERTDAINQSLAIVTDQLKQITNANEEPDYSYSMQDIESDLAKLRLVLNELQTNEQENNSVRLASILDNINQIGNSVEDLQNSLTKEEVFGLRIKFDRINTDIKSLTALTNQLIVKSNESYNALNNTFEDFGKIITSQLSTKVDRVTKLLETSHVSDKVMRQALIYMGEWIDSASASMNKISTNSDEIIDIKSAIEGLRTSVPEQTDILNSIEEKFDEQQERLAYFEKQISKLGGLEDKFEQQQERIDRLEMTIEKILSAVEDIDDSKVTRKIDKIDKQIAKLSTNIEKLASYVD